MTTVYLATPPGGLFEMMTNSFQQEPAPALLVSYVHRASFERVRDRIKFRQFCLDSGAFAAFHSGAVIELDEYIEFCQRAQAADDGPTEIFGLDVIGDWRAGLRNVEAMWKAGVEAIPTYHLNEPEDVLVGMARDYPKIAIGGAIGQLAGPGKYGLQKVREQWLDQCVARVWPKRIHVFGMLVESLLFKIPFHSADSSTWCFGPRQFGRWLAYGKRGRQGRIPTKTDNKYLRPEVDHHLDLERRLKAKWGKELAKL